MPRRKSPWGTSSPRTVDRVSATISNRNRYRNASESKTHPDQLVDRALVDCFKLLTTDVLGGLVDDDLAQSRNFHAVGRLFAIDDHLGNVHDHFTSQRRIPDEAFTNRAVLDQLGALARGERPDDCDLGGLLGIENGLAGTDRALAAESDHAPRSGLARIKSCVVR